MRAGQQKTRLRTLARAIETGARLLVAPAIMAGVLIAFLGLTFLIARLLTTLLDATSLVVLCAAWALTTALGVLLVRQLPRLLT